MNCVTAALLADRDSLADRQVKLDVTASMMQSVMTVDSADEMKLQKGDRSRSW